MSNKKFTELDAVLDFPKQEKQILEYWKSIDILNYTYEQREGDNEKIYYDGPITANGLPHYGHAITWTMKDIIPKFWTMQGFHVTRNLGWDCQGILVEYEVEKKLGFKGKGDVEKYGVEKFNETCRSSVLQYRKSMVEYETRLGRLIDHNAEYATMDTDYIESMWWSLKELYEKGLLYEGHKVVAYSTRSGMTLSTHEVAQGGYEEVVDMALTMKFELEDEPKTYVLAWTTTPWTLPGNLLLAVGKNLEYVKIKKGDENFVLSKDTVEKFFETGEYEVIDHFKGKDLLKKSYIPLFDCFTDRKDEEAFTIVHSDHVSTDEGTGIVHLAPYGMEDFDILQEKRITLFDYLDEEGVFNELVPELQGLFYKEGNNRVVEILNEKNLLLKQEEYAHQMPIDYRTKTPLIYKPIKSWYVNVDKIKDKLLKISESVNFYPESEGNRFRAWISNARDWSLSRKRFWGTPLPLWVSDKTGEFQFVGSFEELSQLSGKDLGEGFDPHKPYVDEITWQGKDGGTFKRVPEVIDVWFDSGAMPFAQFHYPFENKEKFERMFPAEYISEGDEQIRLWFYTMYVLGVALFDQSPFKNVVVIGMLGDENGKKMSKSKGNYPPIEEVFQDYGSDMLRYFLLTSPVVQGEATRFSYDLLLETKKEYFTMLWNSYRYFITYANANNFEPNDEFPNSENVLDQWILARLKETAKNVENNMNNYQIMESARLLRPFVSDLSTWYIRRSRDRISSGDKEALDTLYYILVEFTKIMSPFTPLLAETLYQSLNATELSGLKTVGVETWPQFKDLSKEEVELLQQMQLTRDAVSLALAIRSDEKIKVRQPLDKVYISAKGKIFEEIVMDEVNIKKVELKNPDSDLPNQENDKFKVWLDTNITEELRIEGVAREIIRTIQSLRKKNGLSVEDTVAVVYEDSADNKQACERYEDEIKQKVSAVSLEPGENFDVIKA